MFFSTLIKLKYTYQFFKKSPRNYRSKLWTPRNFLPTDNRHPYGNLTTKGGSRDACCLPSASIQHGQYIATDSILQGSCLF